MNAQDRRILTDVLAGRTQAFGELMERYQDRLFAVAMRVIHQPEDAADVVQETFINAYQSLASFKGDSELYTWLYRIAFNTAISYKRRKRPTLSLDAHRNGDEVRDAIAEPADTSRDIRPGSALERTEDEQTLAEAMKKLSPEHRAILTYKDIDGLKYEDIAEIIQVPIGTVRSRLSRARLELRNLLDPNNEGFGAE